MKKSAYITHTERRNIEGKWHQSIETEKARNRANLVAISSEEKKLIRSESILSKALKPYVEASIKKTLVLTTEDNSNYILLLNKLKNLRSTMKDLRIKKSQIEDVQTVLEKHVTDNIANEIAALINNKQLFINKRNKIEQDAEHIGKNDYLVLFIANGSTAKTGGKANQYVLLGNIQPHHLLDIASPNSRIKFGIISDLSIYDLMTQFMPYFDKINWTIIRSQEDLDEPIDSKLLVDICTELDSDLQQLRVLGDTLGSTYEYRKLDIKHCLWARQHIATWTQFNDPRLIEDWVRLPSKSWLRLEVAMEIASTFQGDIPLIELHDLEISVLGRYFPTRYPQHNERAGALSRCLLAAKNMGFPQEIIDGLASAIIEYPEEMIITVIPDKQDNKYRRMSALLEALQTHSALEGYTFSNSLLEYLDGAGTLQGMGHNQKIAHLNNYLVVQDAAQIELKSILVIDDIVTHGTTLSRAREILIGNGALQVNFITMSMTV